MTPSPLDSRRDQMFPVLDASEIERVRRFLQAHVPMRAAAH